MLMTVCCSPDGSLVFDSSADALRYLDVLCVTIISGLTAFLHCFQAAHASVLFDSCAIACEVLTCRHSCCLLVQQHFSMAVCNVASNRLGVWCSNAGELMLAARRLFLLSSTSEQREKKHYTFWR